MEILCDARQGCVTSKGTPRCQKNRRGGRPPPPAISSPETRGNLFPIVGVGASAGGLEAFTAFLKHLPTDSGMALVLIQHLDPQQHSQLTELLSKATKIPVVEVSVDTPIEPDHVYIMAPAVCLSMADGHLRVERRAGGRAEPAHRLFPAIIGPG
ncbi:MAG: hypothetical protein DMG28_07930 [Acidobacteria bacterium]|nr:MAG: hypothetical protein DMG28_07930 [Acidobacteriota bacterium]